MSYDCSVAKSCQLFCELMDCSLPGSSVHSIFQARILGWVAISSSRGSSQPGDRTQTFCLAGGFFTSEPPGKTLKRFLVLKNSQLLILGSREKVMCFVRIFSFNPVLQLIHPYFTDKKTRRKLRGFAGGPVVKNPPANAGDIGSVPGPERFHMLWGN